jgi:hypothetical protein
MATNLKSVHASVWCWPMMKARYGRIINITSESSCGKRGADELRRAAGIIGFSSRSRAGGGSHYRGELRCSDLSTPATRP